MSRAGSKYKLLFDYRENGSDILIGISTITIVAYIH